MASDPNPQSVQLMFGIADLFENLARKYSAPNTGATTTVDTESAMMKTARRARFSMSTHVPVDPAL